MKVALAPQYRFWMLVLLPMTFGIGTAALWARSLRWPSSVDEHGFTLRYRRKVPWQAVRKIGVWRDYLDGQVSRIDIHVVGGICSVPVRLLCDGEGVAAAILALFRQS